MSLSRSKQLNRAEVVDQNFTATVRAWNGAAKTRQRSVTGQPGGVAASSEANPLWVIAEGDAAMFSSMLSATSKRSDAGCTLVCECISAHAHRPAAVAKRHAQGQRTARENIADLCDEGSFNEYGALAVAAQATRRSADDLMRNTPADGMVTGIGSINGALFGSRRFHVIFYCL